MLSISEPSSQKISCPACGADAQVQYVNRTDIGVQVIRFACPNQSEETHHCLTNRAIADMVVQATGGAQLF